MQILITGGAGFIGSHVVDRLLALGHRVIGLDDFNDYYNPSFKRRNLVAASKNPRFRLIKGDVSNLAKLRKVFSDTKPDIIIHLAARAGVRPSVKDPFLYQRVNVEGTLNVLECARNSGVKKIIFGSTSSVYGINSKVPFNENDPLLNIASPYAATKLAGEAFCRTYSHLYSMDITVLRFFSVYGPRGRPDMAVRHFSERILDDKPISMFGDGSSSRDHTYIDDIVEGILAATQKEFGFKIFNLGGSKATLLRDLIRLIEKAAGKSAKIQHLPNQAGDVPKTFADIRKAKQLLGYNPKTPVEEGIPKFMEWLKKERQGKTKN